MNNQELQKIARRIAELERTIEKGSKKESEKAELKMVELATQLTSLEDMMLVDDMVQEILSKNS